LPESAIESVVCFYIAKGFYLADLMLQTEELKEMSVRQT
jgi:hypothetical protein